MIRKKPTLTEISKLSGFSVSTISRTLIHPEMVKEETKQKIMHYIEKHDYRPNFFARGLQTQRSKIIALIVPQIINLKFQNLIEGVQDSLREAHYTAVIFTSNKTVETEKKILEDILKVQIDGAIIADGGLKTPMTDHLAREIKLVLLDRDGSDKGVDSLVIDREKGFDDLMEHLVRNGHTNIALLAGDFGSYSGKATLKAYRESLEKFSLPYKQDYEVNSLWSARAGWQGAQILLSLETKPTAIIAASDTLASGAIGAIHKKNYKVPEDISIVGFNNEPGSDCMSPPLTTLSANEYQRGWDAAKILIRRLNGEEFGPVYKIYPLEFIERNSVSSLEGKKHDPLRSRI